MTGTSDDILIRMESVEKYYGSFHALKNVNLTVRRGEAPYLLSVRPRWTAPMAWH